MASMGRVVYELTGSGALVGAVSGVRALPMLLLAPLFISPAPKSFGQLTDQRREADQEASDCPAVLAIPAMPFP